VTANWSCINGQLVITWKVQRSHVNLCGRKSSRTNQWHNSGVRRSAIVTSLDRPKAFIAGYAFAPVFTSIDGPAVKFKNDLGKVDESGWRGHAKYTKHPGCYRDSL
jgi:hypothetical protein